MISAHLTASGMWQSGLNSSFDDNPETARVAAVQQLLFPANPRALCEQLGLNWWAALKLHDDGWLSFSPADTPQLDEAQEAELRFVGALVTAGCDRGMLALLLDRLPKPYAYDRSRIFFDWSERRWRHLPDPQAHPEAVFADWLDKLSLSGDVNSLTGILELAQDALTRVGHSDSQAQFDRQR